MLERVLRFVITVFFMIAGGALFELASPVLTLYISTEVFQMEMGILKITLMSFLCILAGAFIGGLIGFFVSPYLTRQLKRFAVFVEQQLCFKYESAVADRSVSRAIVFPCSFYDICHTEAVAAFICF